MSLRTNVSKGRICRACAAWVRGAEGHAAVSRARTQKGFCGLDFLIARSMVRSPRSSSTHLAFDRRPDSVLVSEKLAAPLDGERPRLFGALGHGSSASSAQGRVSFPGPRGVHRRSLQASTFAFADESPMSKRPSSLWVPTCILARLASLRRDKLARKMHAECNDRMGQGSRQKDEG